MPNKNLLMMKYKIVLLSFFMKILLPRPFLLIIITNFLMSSAGAISVTTVTEKVRTLF